MIISAYALAYFGVPRSTGDIDIFVKCSEENSERVFKAMAAFGAPVGEIDPLYLAQYGNKFQIGVAPCRIDIITQIDGVYYEDVDPLSDTIDGIKLQIISKEKFILNNMASGRHKDLADVEALEQGS